MADIGSLLGAAGAGGVIGKAIVSLELSTAKYQAELKAAQGETAASTGAMGSSMGKFSSFASTAWLAVGAAVVAGVAKSISAASDLNEQINKTKVVFEGSADTVLAFAKTTAESLGVSETAALTAAGSFGQILDAAGLAESATSKMSISLVSLASDLASFNNIDPTEALDKLQSGLAGQARPLREVGVFLSAARVEAEAYGSGIAKVGTELTDAQKIQARYNIIMEDTAKAQGDFARTVGESLPNQMRVLHASLEDLAANLGEVLVPVVLEVVKALNDFVTVILFLTGAIPDFNDKVKEAAFNLGDFELHIASWLEKFGGHIPIIGQAVNLWDQFRGSVDEATSAVGQGGKGLDHFRGDAHRTMVEMAGLADTTHHTKIEFADLTLSLDEIAKQTIITRQEFIHASNVMNREARQLDAALREIAKEDWVNPKYVEFLSQQGPEWLVGFANLNETQQHRMQAAWRESTRELDNARDSQDKITEALDTLDKSETRHTVTIQYRYEGFDPSKPGMGGGTPQQR